MQNQQAIFQDFIREFTKLIDESNGNEVQVRNRGRVLLAALVNTDNWLPEAYAKPDLQYFRQYLLHADPLDRFSVVSFVWGPGQETPIHDHTVWALIGMLRGSERGERFELGNSLGEPMRSLGGATLHPGQVDAVSPTIGDIHRVSNFFNDRVSISIHVYGGNIGRISRHLYNINTGATKPFVSGYSNGAD